MDKRQKLPRHLYEAMITAQKDGTLHTDDNRSTGQPELEGSASLALFPGQAGLANVACCCLSGPPASAGRLE